MSFIVGQSVDYYSNSFKAWLRTKVLSINPDGSYNLECKQGADVRSIRFPGEDALIPQQQQQQSILQHSSVLSEPRENMSFTTQSQQVSNSLNFSKPTQLAKIKHGKIELVDSGIKLLASFGSHRKVSVISVVGNYRSGKSFLLSLLTKQQFKTSSSSKRCTEGVWVSAGIDPVDGGLIVFVDCEGINSVDTSDKNFDTKLISFTMLISTIFIFNSRGVIDENSFNTLSLMCSLCRSLFKTNLTNREFSHSTPTPCFIWLLRDFVLDLVDEMGNKISPTEYLEMSVFQKNSAVSTDTRNAFVEVFPHRECYTLVQPMIDEGKLGKLSVNDYPNLRPEFLTDFELFEKRLKSIVPQKQKVFGGACVTTGALLTLMVDFCQMLNSSVDLNLGNIWENVSQALNNKLVGDLIKDHRERLQNDIVSKLPLYEKDLFNSMRIHRICVENKFVQEYIGEKNDNMYFSFHADLIGNIETNESKLPVLNDERCKAIVQNEISEAKKVIFATNDAFEMSPRSAHDKLIRHIEEVRTRVVNSCTGPDHVRYELLWQCMKEIFIECINGVNMYTDNMGSISKSTEAMRCANLENDIVSLKAQVEYFTNECNKKEADLISAEKLHHDKIAACEAQLQAELQEREEILTDTSKLRLEQVQNLEAELVHSQNKINELQAQLEGRSDEERQESKRQLESVAAELHSISMERDELEKKLASTNKTLNEFRDKVTELELDRDKFKSDADKQEYSDDEINSLRARLAERESFCKSQAINVSNLENELENLSKKYIELTEQNQKHLEDIEQKNRELSEARVVSQNKNACCVLL